MQATETQYAELWIRVRHDPSCGYAPYVAIVMRDGEVAQSAVSGLTPDEAIANARRLWEQIPPDPDEWVRL